MSVETHSTIFDSPVAAAPADHALPPFWAAPLFTLISIAGMIGLRLVLLPNQITPIGYGIPMVAFLWLGSPRWLWIPTGAFAVISVVELFVTPPTNHLPAPPALETPIAA